MESGVAIRAEGGGVWNTVFWTRPHSIPAPAVRALIIGGLPAFRRFRGSELRSWSLCSKCFTYWAISPAQFSLWQAWCKHLRKDTSRHNFHICSLPVPQVSLISSARTTVNQSWSIWMWWHEPVIPETEPRGSLQVSGQSGLYREILSQNWMHECESRINYSNDKEN